METEVSSRWFLLENNKIFCLQTEKCFYFIAKFIACAKKLWKSIKSFVGQPFTSTILSLSGKEKLNKFTKENLLELTIRKEL